MTDFRTLTPGRWITLLSILVVLLILVSLTAFYIPVDPLGRFFGRSGPVVSAALSDDILFKLRLPRILAAAVVGGSLGACGVVLQALLRNPLAYPHILGISGGAAVGGIAARLFGFSVVAVGGLTIPCGALAAFGTALATTFLVYLTARNRGRLEPVTLILVGVVFNAFAGATILFLFAVADMREARGILFWMVGSLDFINIDLFRWAGSIALVGICALLPLARSLNILTLGDEAAASLGIRVEKVRIIAFVGTSLVVGAVVSFCGMIGFVGLIIPHLFRLLIGTDHRLLLPASFLGGAAFLVVADLVSRIILYPTQLPVGIITAFCGGPFFLYLLKSHRERTFSNG